MERVLALLYDIHGNLPALEAVLADAGDAGELLLGGDYATAGAWPRETVERLKELENATWIRGNADRWLADRHDAPAPIDEIAARTAELLGDELVAELAELPEQTELGDTLYCHASPRSDMQSFGAEPGPLDTSCSRASPRSEWCSATPTCSSSATGSGGIELLNPAASGCPGTATTAPPTR